MSNPNACEINAERGAVEVRSFLRRLSPRVAPLLGRIDALPSASITAAYASQFVFSPVPVESIEPEFILLLQSDFGTGQLFTEHAVQLPDNLLGADCRHLSAFGSHFELCGLDAAASAYSPAADETFCVSGTPQQKMARRTQLLVGEVQRIISAKALARPRVACVGAVGSLIQSLASLGCDVRVTDLHPALVNTKVAGKLVEDGLKASHEVVAAADIALVTGMTISTFTLDGILEAASKHDTAIVIFAQSAAHVAPHLCGGTIACVFCEDFPFYLFPGNTQVRIFRAPAWQA